MNREQLELEFSFKTSRSSGAGGQHVNKVETQVELILDIENSLGLSAREKAMVLEKLANRIDQNGMLHLVANTTRSQIRNKREVTRKVFELLESALVKPKKRIATKPSKKAIQNRLDSKSKKADIKKGRGWKYDG